MMNEKKAGTHREMPRAHLYHTLLPIIFVIVWILDSQMLELTTWLNSFIPFELRFTLFIITLILAFTFMILSHKALFHDNEPSNKLVTRGILSHTRNPMYFGILLIYVSFLCQSISIICLILFIPIFLIYNKMADFEGNILEEMFGDDYLEYKKKVPKWIPSIKSKI